MSSILAFCSELRRSPRFCTVSTPAMMAVRACHRQESVLEAVDLGEPHSLVVEAALLPMPVLGHDPGDHRDQRPESDNENVHGVVETASRQRRDVVGLKDEERRVPRGDRECAEQSVTKRTLHRQHQQEGPHHVRLVPGEHPSKREHDAGVEGEDDPTEDR
jgi:hypothetical protein